MSRSRHIDLPGCFNLRDLGGLPSRGGDRVAWGRLYRGGELSKVRPQQGDELVRVHGIRRVIDLRTVGEAQDSPFPLSAPCRRISIPLFTSFRPHWIRPREQSPDATAARYMEMIEDGMPAIVRIVDELVETEWAPTLIHCAAGRDRTGIVVMFLLDLLDIEEDLIAADYALSDGVVNDGERATAETIHHLLSLLRRRHSSTRDMLIEAGAPPRRIDQLRETILEGA